jgi:hypothetical protein
LPVPVAAAALLVVVAATLVEVAAALVTDESWVVTAVAAEEDGALVDEDLTDDTTADAVLDVVAAAADVAALEPDETAATAVTDVLAAEDTDALPVVEPEDDPEQLNTDGPGMGYVSSLLDQVIPSCELTYAPGKLTRLSLTTVDPVPVTFSW